MELHNPQTNVSNHGYVIYILFAFRENFTNLIHANVIYYTGFIYKFSNYKYFGSQK